MSPVTQGATAKCVREEHQLSERRACRLTTNESMKGVASDRLGRMLLFPPQHE